MLARDDDAADVRVPPPLVYLAGLVAGVVLHGFVLPLDLALPAPVRIAAAVLTGGAGLFLVAVAFGAFRRTRQNPKPWKTTPVFLATGAYRWSRNPMYTGMALVLAGLAFGLANGWILALVPAVLAVVHRTAVRPEEAYLERKFGEPYRAYRCSVRRWL